MSALDPTPQPAELVDLIASVIAEYNRGGYMVEAFFPDARAVLAALAAGGWQVVRHPAPDDYGTATWTDLWNRLYSVLDDAAHEEDESTIVVVADRLLDALGVARVVGGEPSR